MCLLADMKRVPTARHGGDPVNKTTGTVCEPREGWRGTEQGHGSVSLILGGLLGKSSSTPLPVLPWALTMLHLRGVVHCSLISLLLVP